MDEIKIDKKNELKHIKGVAEKIIDNYNQSQNIFEKDDIIRNMYNMDKNIVKSALEDFDEIVKIMEYNLNISKIKQTNEEETISIMNKRSFIQMISELSDIIKNDNKELLNIYDKFCQDINDIKQNIFAIEKQLSYMK